MVILKFISFIWKQKPICFIIQLVSINLSAAYNMQIAGENSLNKLPKIKKQIFELKKKLFKIPLWIRNFLIE